MMNNRFGKLVSAIFAALFLSFANCSELKNQLELVSIVAIIAVPHNYDGKQIAVYGYLHIDNEFSGLCLSDRVPSPKECVWVYVDKSNVKQIELANNSLVFLEGLFNAKDKGHLDLLSGSIVNITRVSKKKAWHLEGN